MPRLTLNTENGTQLAAGVSLHQVEEKLAAFEQFGEDILAEQDKIAEKMDFLRSQGKEKSVKFRELFAQKLTNAAILARLKAAGLM